MEHAEEAAALERPSGGGGPFSNQRGEKIGKRIAMQKGSEESAAATRTREVPIKTVIYRRLEPFGLGIVKPLPR